VSLAEPLDITVEELPDSPLDATFQGILRAYTAEGYEQGYARGTRDLLSLYPLLIEQFLHAQGSLSGETVAALRRFADYVERHVGRKLDDAGYVDGGLGI